MTVTYFTLVTNQGTADLVAAIAADTTLDITTMKLGDGGGSATTPVATQTALVNEVYSAALDSLTVDEDLPNTIVAEMIVPSDTGGWTVREVGLFSSTGDLVAVANFPDTYKPELMEGAGRDLIVRLFIQVTNSAAVSIIMDPDTAIASQAWCLSMFPLSVQIPGGTTGQVLAKTSGTDGAVQWNDPLETSEHAVTSSTTWAAPVPVLNSQMLVKITQTGGPWELTFTGVTWPQGVAQQLSQESGAVDFLWLTNVGGTVYARIEPQTLGRYVSDSVLITNSLGVASTIAGLTTDGTGISSTLGVAGGIEAWGLGAGNGSMTGITSTMVGTDAAHAITSGSDVTAIGWHAATAITTAIGVTAIGAGAGSAITTAGNGTYVGAQAGLVDVTGANTYVGFQAAKEAASGGGNTVIGASAANGDIGNDNTIIGTSACISAVIGSHNAAVGFGTEIDTGVNFAVVIGGGAHAQQDYDVAIGYGATAFNGSIALGAGAAPSTGQMLTVGSTAHPISIWNNGEPSGTPSSLTISSQPGYGADIATGDIIICAGASTGSAPGGDIEFISTLPGTEGSVTNDEVLIATLHAQGAMTLNSVAADPDLSTAGGGYLVDILGALYWKGGSGTLTLIGPA